MKNLVPWLKQHWIIPVLTLIALAALPTAWYFAEDMHAKDSAALQDRINKEIATVSDTSAKLEYSLPDMNGAGKVLEKKGVLNETLIQKYAVVLADMQAKVGGVSQQGIDFNKGEHKLLIEGLFPPPANDRVAQDNLGRTFIERLIAYHNLLLTQMKAGQPAKPEDVAKLLSERKSAEEARVKAELNRDLTPAEQAKLTEELVGLRLSALRKRATEISVYADATVFENLPLSVPADAPSPSQCWDWQERSWINQDICKAIGLTNEKSTGGIPDSIVKRLIRISIRPSLYGGTDREPASAPFDAGDDKPPLDFGVSITGRNSGPGHRNRWYDVRYVTVDVIISSQKIPQFVNALAAINFISVIDMDLTRVEPLIDLRDGYDYGDDHVVKATLTLETICLREWRKQAMPPKVQQALGMDEKVAGEATPAAAAPRAKPAAGGNPNKPPAGAGGRNPRGGAGTHDDNP